MISTSYSDPIMHTKNQVIFDYFCSDSQKLVAYEFKFIFISAWFPAI